MDKLFLVIGPSGVGKSKTINGLNLPDKFVTRKLDNLICEYNNEVHISQYFEKIGNHSFFKKSTEAIERIASENPDKIIIIDIGAGSIDWEMCFNYYSKFITLLIIADKKEAYRRIKERSKNETRSFNEYIESEFKPHKVKLFDSAKYKIDTSILTIVEASTVLENIIRNACS